MNSKCLRILITLLLLSSPSLYAAKVGLLVMATGKYITFVPPLVASADKYFCKNHDVTYFVFTDGQFDVVPNKVVPIFHPRMGWPLDTMMRNHVYEMNSDAFADQDYLYACDADMLFVGNVGDEILGKRMATEHPGFYGKNRKVFSFETNPLSKAYIAPNEGVKYFCGGFFGGEREAFLDIVRTTSERVDEDLANDIVAVWHDESHWNRYCIDYPPTVILNPSYCFPQGSKLPFVPRLIALNKNHQDMRFND
jgi:histo-blood group ABO system transferase